MRLLIVKLGSIGDIVHALPALAAMRRALPEARLSWVVERRAAEVLRSNPFVDELIEVDTRRLRRGREMWSEAEWTPTAQWRRLRSVEPDVAIDFQGLWKSALIARLSGARERYGFAREGLREPSSRMLLTKTFDVESRVHVIRKNLALAAEALQIAVPIHADEYEFPIAVAPEHELEARRVIEQVGEEFVILNPGGGWWTKLWDAERFGKLADELRQRHGLRSVVTFGPGEEQLAGRVVAASRTASAQSASLSLKGFFALARQSRVYVGGDTGPTHLAIAAGAPIVGLFGPTEWWRNGSPRAADIPIERMDIGCRENCHRRSCDNWICMDIEVARVADGIGERLQRRRQSERIRIDHSAADPQGSETNRLEKMRIG